MCEGSKLAHASRWSVRWDQRRLRCDAGARRGSISALAIAVSVRLHTYELVSTRSYPKGISRSCQRTDGCVVTGRPLGTLCNVHTVQYSSHGRWTVGKGGTNIEHVQLASELRLNVHAGYRPLFVLCTACVYTKVDAPNWAGIRTGPKQKQDRSPWNFYGPGGFVVRCHLGR